MAGFDIKTFDNATGGSTVFKALGHPLIAAKAPGWIAGLAARGPLALFDPQGVLQDLAALYDLSAWTVAEIYVQRVEDLGRMSLGRAVKPVSALADSTAATVLVLSFDGARAVSQIEPVKPEAMEVETLDALKLPDALLSVRGRYLDKLNFATDFIFFRDQGGWHTRLVTANYWHNHGATATRLWLRLFDEHGTALASWEETVSPGASLIELDSAEIRARHNLPEFTGSLFIHAIGAAGHDVIKYALDTYGDSADLMSCTHDSNSWPADFYAGVPAPRDGETVRLWLQNCHPVAVPAGTVGLNLMGHNEVLTLDRPIEPFATCSLDLATLFPNARWPAQLELRADRRFVRPRYEIENGARRRIAHANVERTDLKPDIRLAELEPLIGKGYILPAALLPLDGWKTILLPTPMATGQTELPVAVTVYDSTGVALCRHPLGRLARSESTAVDIDALLAGRQPAGGYGHVELAYDFSGGGLGDGWLHALFRYERRDFPHGADTSFGAHIYNLPVVYRNEPQSYTGSPPGLTTRLFLRLGRGGDETLCHLIYPASGKWRPRSDTLLLLHDAQGQEVARRQVTIAMGGSLFWRLRETFDAKECRAAEKGYVVVRDASCRLFGFHGAWNARGGFSFDHMFGF
jgi:hypothetical protein